MPTPKKGPRLGAGPAHQKQILANLAVQLIEHGRITTTEAKAQAVQPLFEKLVTKARRGDLHARRLAVATLHSKDAVYRLFDVVTPQIDAERSGGYTRIVRIGNRRGDNAPLAQISIVTEKVEKKAVLADAEQTARRAAETPAGEAEAPASQEVPGTPADAEGGASPAGEAEPAAGSAPSGDAKSE